LITTSSRGAASPRPLSAAQSATADAVARLSLADKAALIAEVMRTYCLVRWNLHRVELEPLVERLRTAKPTAGRPLSEEAAERHATRLGYVVGRMLRVVPTDAPCLVQSLVLTSLLAARGIPGQLVIGVTIEPFAAHAWVEHKGHPLLPTEAVYRRLVEL
jgi:hypothetical protein